MGIGTAAGSPQARPVSVRAMASTWRSRKIAPFGFPVVPEVKTTWAKRSGSLRRGGGERSAPAFSSSCTSEAAATTKAGRASSTHADCSVGASLGFTPAVAAPAFATATASTTHSTPDARVSPTTSPGPRPLAASAAASASERRSSSE